MSTPSYIQNNIKYIMKTNDQRTWSCCCYGSTDTIYSKKFKKVPSGIYCRVCIKKKNGKHREYLKRDILGIRKRKDLLKEWAEKRKERARVAKKNPVERLPKIRGEKKQSRERIRGLAMWLTSNEKYVLYRKYVKKGLSPAQANDKIRNTMEHLNNLVKKLRSEKKSEKEISRIFKEEFAKLR